MLAWSLNLSSLPIVCRRIAITIVCRIMITVVVLAILELVTWWGQQLRTSLRFLSALRFLSSLRLFSVLKKTHFEE
jgi:hypothetical protein